MKCRGFLVASTILNLALLAVFGWLLREKPGAMAERVILQARTNAVPRAIETAVPSATAVTFGHRFRWTTLDPDNFSAYAANLQASGCPEKTVRDILLAAMDRFYRRRRQEVDRASGRAFWQTGEQQARAHRKRSTELFKLAQEERATISSVLGVELDPEAMKVWVEEDVAGLGLGYLPEGIPERVLSIGKKFADSFEYVDDQAGHLITPEDQARKRELFDQMMGAFAGITSPAEVEEGMLRLTVMVTDLFHNNRAIELNLTGHELRELTKLKHRSDDPVRQEFEWEDEENENRKRHARKEFDDGARALLGEARFGEYQRAHDNAFQTIVAITDQHKLPKETAIKMYEIRGAAQDAAESTRLNPALSRSERRVELKSIQEATEQALSTTLGEKVLKDYRTKDGEWLPGLGKP